jgi:hypothetical protein
MRSTLLHKAPQSTHGGAFLHHFEIRKAGNGGDPKAWGEVEDDGNAWRGARASGVDSAPRLVVLRIQGGLGSPKGWKVEDCRVKRKKTRLRVFFVSPATQGMHHLPAQVIKETWLGKIPVPG